MNSNDKYLIKLVQAAVLERPPVTPDFAVNWEYIYKQAAFHQVANTVFYSILMLPESDRPSETVFEKFREQAYVTIAQEAMQQSEAEALYKEMDKNGIAACPLKGWIMKQLYPRTDMRSMSDVDILIRKRDENVVKKLMKQMNYTKVRFSDDVDVYHKAPGVTIEVHKYLFGELVQWHRYYENIWDRLVASQDTSNTYEMTAEDFYIYLVVHMVKHYINSGTGIRSILDIWIYKEKYRSKMNPGYLNEQWRSLGLERFIVHLERMSDIWFGNSDAAPLYDEMGDYILSCGVYGINSHLIVMNNALNGKDTVTKKKWKYVFERAFLRRELMTGAYPILKKYPFLLPVCWIRRFLKSIFQNRKHTYAVLVNLKNLKTEDAQRIENLHRNTGLL